MREIKFRGYNTENKKWLESMTIMKNNEKYYMVVEEMQSGGILKPTLPVEEASIGQYTGFNDKNGVEIYEGDIIKVEKDKELYQVIFNEHIGQWLAIGMSENTDDRLFQFTLFKCEVIGNIYEEGLKDGN